MASTTQRAHLRVLMKLLLAHEPQIGYPINDVRGADDLATFELSEADMKAAVEAGKRLVGDCSGMTTNLFHWCGLKDPNGLAYAHQGYTGTMLAHLPHYINPASAKVGALAVFGPGTGEHVGIVYTPDNTPTANPMLWSHGGENGPILIKLKDEARWHKPPITMLSIIDL